MLGREGGRGRKMGATAVTSWLLANFDVVVVSAPEYTMIYRALRDVYLPFLLCC